MLYLRETAKRVTLFLIVNGGGIWGRVVVGSI